MFCAATEHLAVLAFDDGVQHDSHMTMHDSDDYDNAGDDRYCHHAIAISFKTL